MSESLMWLAELADKRQVPQVLELLWEQSTGINPVAVALGERRQRRNFLLSTLFMLLSMLCVAFALFSLSSMGLLNLFLGISGGMGLLLFVLFCRYRWGRRSYNQSPYPQLSRSELDERILSAETFAQDFMLLCKDLAVSYPGELCLDKSELKAKVEWILSYYAKHVLYIQDQLKRQDDQNLRDKLAAQEKNTKQKFGNLHFSACRLKLVGDKWDPYFAEGKNLLDAQRELRHRGIEGLSKRFDPQA